MVNCLLPVNEHLSGIVILMADIFKMKSALNLCPLRLLEVFEPVGHDLNEGH